MAWMQLAQIDLTPTWLYTPVSEGAYFKISHGDYSTGGFLILSQFDSDGVRSDSIIIKPSAFPEIIYLPKPPTFTTRKLGLRLQTARGWQVTIEASDYFPSETAIDLSVITNQLNTIESTINELSTPIIDLEPILSRLDMIDSSIAAIPATDLSLVLARLDEIEEKIDNIQITPLPPTYDIDAQAVIAAIQNTGVMLSDTQKTACNARIVAMKDSGVWAKRLAYYGFLGGTAVAHAINWKSPGTYNINWSSNSNHSVGGVTGSGSNGESTGIPLNLFNARNIHLAFYNRSTDKAFYASAMIDAQNQTFYIENKFFRCSRGANNGGNNSDARTTVDLYEGYFIASTINTPDINIYKNGDNISTSKPSGLPEDYNFTINTPIALFAVNPFNSYSSANIASCSIGYSLSVAEVSNDYTAEQAYQSALGRQI